MRSNACIKNLAEAIILQSIEDLWDKDKKNNCLGFFLGEGFQIYARIAGLKLSDRIELLRLICGPATRALGPMEPAVG